MPANAGAATLTFTPAEPTPGATVRVDVRSAEGYTNVSLDVAGPLPTGAPTATYIDVIPGFHWLYDVTLPAAGTYRFTFTADPGGTVYGVAYLNVVDPTAADAGLADGGLEPDSGPSARPDAASPRADAGPGQDAGRGRTSAEGCGCRVGGTQPRDGSPPAPDGFGRLATAQQIPALQDREAQKLKRRMLTFMSKPMPIIDDSTLDPP